MTAITEQITNESVIDAVSAAFQQGRTFSDHWTYYMNAEQHQAFSDNCRVFVDACEVRLKWLRQ